MIEIAEAYQQLAALATTCRAKRAQRPAQVVPVTQANGRVLATSVTCRYDAPGFDQSAMDGIAFAWQEDLRQLKVVGVVAAGDVPDSVALAAGTCVRMMTGAPVPTSADTVVPVERLTFSDDGTHVCVNVQPQIGDHVRKRGENLRQGAPLFAANTWINATVLSALAAQGIAEVSVKPKIQVGILTTGNEVVDHRATLAAGQIHDSNGPGIAALLDQPHIAWESLGSMPDQLQTLRDLLANHTYLDLIILTGGVSMGDFDFVPQAAQDAGFRHCFHKVRIKPGKPLLVSEHPAGTVLFGLPGNPVSSLVSTRLFVLPFISGLVAKQMQAPLMLELPLSSAAEGAKFPYYVPVQWDQWQGELAVKPVPISGSGDIVRFAQGETLACLPPTKKLCAGEKVQVLLLHSHRVG